MRGVTVISHPLVQHNLTILRDKRTGPQDFRQLLSKITALLLYEATRDVETRDVNVATPLAPAKGTRLNKPVALVPVLRAGLGMLDTILHMLPESTVGFIGLKRDEETLEPEIYHQSLPRNLARHETILIDPMLATGGSAVCALRLLAKRHARRVRFVNLVAAPEGVKTVLREFMDVRIFTASLDADLNDRGYIVPGLGDAGDRQFDS